MRIGRIRIKLAELVKAELLKVFEFEDVIVLPENLIPVQGRWRSDIRFDVMRWNGSVEVKTEFGYRVRGIGSWDTMTDCVKNGLSITYDDLDFEVCAK